MIVLLDTSTPICKLGVFADGKIQWHEWQANRQLAHGLLNYLSTTISTYGNTLSDISGIGVFRGPGSFTGLRIGLTVANTLADSIKIPIVGQNGETWFEDALMRLQNGESDTIVLPDYGADAHITKPRK